MVEDVLGGEREPLRKAHEHGDAALTGPRVPVCPGASCGGATTIAPELPEVFFQHVDDKQRAIGREEFLELHALAGPSEIGPRAEQQPPHTFPREMPAEPFDPGALNVPIRPGNAIGFRIAHRIEHLRRVALQGVKEIVDDLGVRTVALHGDDVGNREIEDHRFDPCAARRSEAAKNPSSASAVRPRATHRTRFVSTSTTSVAYRCPLWSANSSIAIRRTLDKSLVSSGPSHVASARACSCFTVSQPTWNSVATSLMEKRCANRAIVSAKRLVIRW